MKIGIIGCGKIVRVRHAPECAANLNIELAGFYDFKLERAEELAGEFGGRAYPAVEAMLNDPTVDGVIVCTANKTHAPITIQALKAGKHVLCEKPMCTSMEEAIAMEKAAEEANRILMIAHNQRMDHVHMRAKELLHAGAIGKVISFKTEFSHGGPEGWSIDSGNSWFFNKNEAFIGAMGDLGVHKIDFMRWMLEDDIVSVSAKVLNLDKKDGKGNPAGIDDCGICLVQMKKGVWGTITANWCNYGTMDNSTTLYGTEGVMAISDPYAADPIVVAKRNDVMRYQVPEQEISHMADVFADAVAHGKESPISGAEGVKCMEVVMAALKSSEEQKTIHIS